MTTLRFDGDDPRDFSDTLIEAMRVTDMTGERPSIEVDGKVYAGHDLVKVALLLTYDEPPRSPCGEDCRYLRSTSVRLWAHSL